MAPWREFYTSLPQRALALDELEQAALLRLRVLRALVTAPSTERFYRTAQDLPTAAHDALALLDADCDLDRVAHYALRLAFCTQRDRLDWLIDAEARLMAFRLRAQSSDELLRILHHHGRKYRVYSVDEVGGLVSGSASAWIQQADRSSVGNFVRVPFHETARLVARRQVLLDRGYCWLPVSLLYLAVVQCFTASLRIQVTALHRSLPAKRQEIERLREVLDRIYAESLLIQHVPRGLLSERRERLVVTPQNIDDVAEKHFPLCMKHLHRKMREHHHLKFDGRVQYRVFLKGLGFSVHDNILFFRNEFTKVIPPAKFDKEYVYHIRHSYGLEGSRKDYAPMDCQKIIHGGAPRHGQYHGCPFKHWDVSTLETELRRMGLTPSHAETIAQTAGQGHHETACASLFEALHHRPFQATDLSDTEASAMPMHPNEWVHASAMSLNP